MCLAFFSPHCAQAALIISILSFSCLPSLIFACFSEGEGLCSHVPLQYLVDLDGLGHYKSKKDVNG